MAGLLLARLFRKNARFVGQLLGKAEAQEGVNMSQYARQPFRGKAVCLLKKKKLSTPLLLQFRVFPGFINKSLTQE